MCCCEVNRDMGAEVEELPGKGVLGEAIASRTWRGGEGRPWKLGGEVHQWHSSHTHTHASFTQFPELQPKIARSFFNDLCFEVSGHCSAHLGAIGMKE